MLQIEEEDIVIGGLKVKVKFKWKLGSFITYMVACVRFSFFCVMLWNSILLHSYLVVLLRGVA